MQLKHISPASVPSALALAERYRLLNEPEQAASIYRDVLAADPGNKDALRDLFLCVTDQFSHKHGPGLDAAEELVAQMDGEYERAYYRGVACERWARAKLHEGAHASFVGNWLRSAMESYELAERLGHPGDENAKLRWNACCRLMQRVPGLAEEREDVQDLGD